MWINLFFLNYFQSNNLELVLTEVNRYTGRTNALRSILILAEAGADGLEP